MKTKSKMIASIMSICLVCAVFAIGVFALKTANLKIGGDVSFNATGVEADIKNVTLTGATTNDQVLATGKINTSMTQADIDTTFQNWQTLKLDFDENATDIELKFDIANTSANPDNYIEIDYSYSFSNANPNVDVFPGDENDQDVWENNNYILAPKGATPDANDYETFTLKFRVLNKELNVPEDTKVDINIQLKHHKTVEGSLVDGIIATPDGLKYGIDEESHTAYLYGGEGDGSYNNHSYNKEECVIAPVISSGSNVYIVTKIEEFAFCDLGEGNTKIKNLAMPNSITNIEGSAFFYLRNVISLQIPKSVSSGGLYINHGTATEMSYANIYMPNTLTDINGMQYCVYLSSIDIPSSICNINANAFLGCTRLTSVTFKDTTDWSVSNGEETIFLDLSNPVQNATYLTTTYVDYTWSKSI
ncbi:MAG: leucine-rich repeat protein [Clostridia bacterium]|nr:leucine-rich repeat protein [Clostridia bacterium]